jgi:hypothetical protein
MKSTLTLASSIQAKRSIDPKLVFGSISRAWKEPCLPYERKEASPEVKLQWTF